MTLKDVTQMVFGKNTKDKFIGIYKGVHEKICPDYADEMLETHGDHNVIDYQYVESKKVLVVAFETEETK